MARTFHLLIGRDGGFSGRAYKILKLVSLFLDRKKIFKSIETTLIFKMKTSLLFISAILACFNTAHGLNIGLSCVQNGLQLGVEPLQQSGTPEVIDKISDESGNDQVTCHGNLLGVGGQCTEKFCDFFEFSCVGVSDPSGNRFQVRDISGFDTKTTDGRDPAICPADEVMVGVDCDGRFCDDMKIRCAKLVKENPDRSSDVSFAETEADGCQWTDSFNKDSGSETCPAGTFSRGLSCTGRFCSEVSLFCCPGVHYTCQES